MIELNIKRSDWLRRANVSDHHINSRLLDSYNRMCCMGFDARYICGIPTDIMLDMAYPEQIKLGHLNFIPKMIDDKNVIRLSRILANVNDRSFGNASSFYWANSVSNKEQEEIIARLYTLVGYKITFKDW